MWYFIVGVLADKCILKHEPGEGHFEIFPLPVSSFVKGGHLNQWFIFIVSGLFSFFFESAMQRKVFCVLLHSVNGHNCQT